MLSPWHLSRANSFHDLQDHHHRRRSAAPPTPPSPSPPHHRPWCFSRDLWTPPPPHPRVGVAQWDPPLVPAANSVNVNTEPSCFHAAAAKPAAPLGPTAPLARGPSPRAPEQRNLLDSPTKSYCGQIPSWDDRRVPRGSRCLLLSDPEASLGRWLDSRWTSCGGIEFPLVRVYSADQVQELVAECLRARDMAYCPYSRFPVGAAVRSADGAIITGDSQTAPPPTPNIFGIFISMNVIWGGGNIFVCLWGNSIYLSIHFMFHVLFKQQSEQKQKHDPHCWYGFCTVTFSTGSKVNTCVSCRLHHCVTFFSFVCSKHSTSKAM